LLEGFEGFRALYLFGSNLEISMFELEKITNKAQEFRIRDKCGAFLKGDRER